MTISVSLSEELVGKIKNAAQHDHRSISGQIAFFCDRGMSNLLEPAIEESKGSSSYGSSSKKESATRASKS
ncbi:MAG: hypothetical protein GWO81_00435 [Verrucomicrobia bacterium]|nr:hypothetical protein [Verrucomicrobiota bacterium]